ncbi:RDD family protein [Actinoplanes sp. L3-i22]|uniref:RDD family protein n=1 Tax=Actinoplanes sp. L3-i22 TaxID=2836373 RepID=UPI0021037F3D|nr:RDD family protein [Actinoplanes sp. L3-i22]
MNAAPSDLVTASDLGTASELVTAEAVALDLRPARLGSRAIALGIDILIQVMVAGGVMLFVGLILASLPDSIVDDALVSAVLRIVIVLVLLLYPTLVEVRTNGRSVGKSAMGLRVIREDGGPIRVRHAFTRALIGLAVEWPGLLLPFLTWVVTLAVMLFSAKGRRLGDLAAGTIVVHEKRPVPFRFVPALPAGLAAWAAATDLSAVDDDLAGQVRQFVSRAPELSEPHRGSLERMLTAEVAARVTPPPPPGTTPYYFLATVLAERRRRYAAQLAAGRAVTERLLPGFGRSARQLTSPVRPSAPSY